jgi:hypothetical protein
MWIYTKYGFISVVRSTLTSHLVVRAREQAHLQNLFPLEDGIFYSPSSDYSYRLYITQKDFNDFLKDLAEDIDYPNFKDALPRVTVAERRYLNLCESIWVASWSRLNEGIHRVGTRAFAGLTENRVVKALSPTKG